MRINSSQINLSSSNLNFSYESKSEHLRKWDKNSELVYDSYEENGSILRESSQQNDRLELSGQSPLQNQITDSLLNTDDAENDLIPDSLKEIWGDLKMQIVKDLVEMFTGKKIHLLKTDDISDPNAADSTPETQDINQANTPKRPASERPQLQGWGIQYDYSETRYQKEGFQFSASGTITNDKGQQIQFNTTLEMSRERYEQINVSLKAGDALIDPLVINFSGTGASFSGIKFDFDLNADGKTEKISSLAPGSAFLAYDKNGNGIIDDGSELFGPSSGNGFSELADLDEDKNGWIDENDSAFSSLKLWEKNSDGSNSLSSLLQRNVGALYTGRTDTAYNLNGKDSLAGVIKETGLWLKETGGTGFMQEVDIVV